MIQIKQTFQKSLVKTNFSLIKKFIFQKKN